LQEFSWAVLVQHATWQVRRSVESAGI